jgi:hypothetical protein
MQVLHWTTTSKRYVHEFLYQHFHANAPLNSDLVVYGEAKLGKQHQSRQFSVSLTYYQQRLTNNVGGWHQQAKA